MVSTWALILISAGYLALLFVLAWWGDRTVRREGAPQRRPFVYTLALTVYCTTWSVFGTSAQAATTGWPFPPTLVGSIVIFVLFGSVLRKLIEASAKHNITSIADFISSRYGKSRGLAVLATMIAIVCVVPYIALQLKAVTESFEIMTGGTAASARNVPLYSDTGFYVALLMGGLALLFGTRRLVSTDQNHGLMLAVAFEGIFKLLAILAVGFFAVYGLYDGFGDIMGQVRDAKAFELAAAQNTGSYAFLSSVVLGAAAILCLPHVFHVLVVEHRDGRDFKTAWWVFPLYMVLMGLFSWPIAAVTLLMMPEAAVSGYPILSLLHATDQGLLALLVYLGGLSAATSMVVIACIALGVMLGNEVVAPLAFKGRLLRADQREDVSVQLRMIRRLSIVGLLVLAYAYYRLLSTTEELAAAGLLSMALAAQFMPAILGGLYWREGHARGVTYGLAAGLGVWAYTLLIPAILRAGELDGSGFLEAGPLNAGWLRPESLFGLDGLHPVAHGAFWSLLANTGVYILVSLQNRHNLIQRVQASTFTQLAFAAQGDLLPDIKVNDLRLLVGRFIGTAEADDAFGKYFRAQGRLAADQDAVDRELFVFAERLLASAIGTASARVVLAPVTRGGPVPMRDVLTIAEEASEVFRFNRDLLQTSMDNVSVGISVIDKHHRLVAWNTAYEEMYPYPPGFLYEGRHIRDLIQYNAERGECGPGDPQLHVEKRMRHLAAGTAYTVQRTRQNGTVIEIRGKTIPGGGFVTSFTDITDFKSAEWALKEMNESLEQRVTDRTQDLTLANKALESAKLEAETANQAKTRFFAAISHDVLQPLNAARLFAASLQTNQEAENPVTVQLEQSLNAVHELLGEVLDLSKLDAGVVEPSIQSFSLNTLFEELAPGFDAMAQEKTLSLTVVSTNLWVRSDRQHLRRIIQNFLSNAVRYAGSGRILLGARRAGKTVRIEVWDTGPGVTDNQAEVIFGEFHRGNAEHGEGLGLGLAIVKRLADLLQHRVGVRSVAGKGSVFSVDVPRTEEATVKAPEKSASPSLGTVEGAQVLCIDNDAGGLSAMKTLLETWGCGVSSASGWEAALSLQNGGAAKPHLIIADYHLDHGHTGIELLAKLGERWTAMPPCIVISADQDNTVRTCAKQAGHGFLSKPVRAAALKTLMRSLLGSRIRLQAEAAKDQDPASPQ